jgi:uncharacterized repeat protein (TIGR03803 family)
VLYTFSGGADGAVPGELIRGPAGNFYGTTLFGGNFSGPCSPYGCGVVFKLDPAGNETVLYTFTGGTDGALPGNLLHYKGSLYGTTGSGGDTSCNSSSSPPGCGVVFKLH